MFTCCLCAHLLHVFLLESLNLTKKLIQNGTRKYMERRRVCVYCIYIYNDNIYIYISEEGIMGGNIEAFFQCVFEYISAWFLCV